MLRCCPSQLPSHPVAYLRHPQLSAAGGRALTLTNALPLAGRETLRKRLLAAGFHNPSLPHVLSRLFALTPLHHASHRLPSETATRERVRDRGWCHVPGSMENTRIHPHPSPTSGMSGGDGNLKSCQRARQTQRGELSLAHPISRLKSSIAVDSSGHEDDSSLISRVEFIKLRSNRIFGMHFHRPVESTI